jgi:hypothetical protein
MLPKYHFYLGLLFSLLAWLLFPSIGFIGFSLIYLSSFFLDFDHYLYYVYQKHDLSLKNAYSWFIKKGRFLCSLTIKQRQQYKKPIIIFHGIEFWSILIILSFFYPIISFVIFGIFIHIATDLIHFIYVKEPLYSKLSQISTYKRNKGKKEIIFPFL